MICDYHEQIAYRPLDRKPVLSKRDFTPRYKAGEFGNASITWNTLSEYISAQYPGPVHLRNRVANAATWYNLDIETLLQAFEEAYDLGFGPDDLYISAMAPHHLNLLQGEVMQLPEGLTLFYSTAKDLPMRDALASSGKQVHGIMATSLLKANLCPRSYDWLMFLLEAYEGHVVEFSTFRKEWGTVPGYNTVYWEVRNY